MLKIRKMPALIHFHRKWLIACDDLVVPFAIEAFFRLAWLLAAFLMTFLVDCSDSLYTRYLMYTIIGNFSCSLSLCIIISILSSKGSVLEVEKRIHISKVLYFKWVTILIDVTVASFSIWMLVQETNMCIQKKIFFKVTTTCLCLYIMIIMFGIFLSYNSLGAPQYWDAKKIIDPEKLFKRAKRTWRHRLKCFCCCADVNEDENNLIFVEIATFLATFSNDFDAAPTDILAGLISLSKKHAIERRKFESEEALNADVSLAQTPVPSWMSAENALYFHRIAKSTYGWLAFFDPLQPWKLCTLFPFPRHCFSSINQQDIRKTGDCGNCNSSAFEKITGLPDSEILYASFSNLVHEPAFVILLDHQKKSLIIAISGTRSFSDALTVFDGEQLDFPKLHSEVTFSKIKCHRGALRSALYIQKKIQELNILNLVLCENPTYALILCGHSLGGSVAATLGLLLFPEYPSLQCYAFAPFPVISSEGVFKTMDFVFSVVLEDDLIPRLSIHCIKNLMMEMHKSLEETQIPKYKILLKFLSYYLKKHLHISKNPISSSEAYENKQVEVNESPAEIVFDELPVKSKQPNMPVNETHLYIPGRVLHLKKGEECEYSWMTGFNFQKILISPCIVEDHQPHQIKHFLEKYKSSQLYNAFEPDLKDICTRL